MVVLDVVNIFNSNAVVGNCEFPDELMDLSCSPKAVQMVYYVDFAVRHRSTAHTKERWAVAGTTKKMFRQKGTGNARHGTARAGQMRGGGVTFGPTYSEKKMKINKTMRLIATLTCLNNHIKRGTLCVVDNFTMQEVKTKQAFKVISELSELKFHSSVKKLHCLVVSDSGDPLVNNFMLSSRNIVGVKSISNSYINVMDLVSNGFLIVSKSALLNIIDSFKEKLI